MLDERCVQMGRHYGCACDEPPGIGARLAAAQARERALRAALGDACDVFMGNVDDEAEIERITEQACTLAADSPQPAKEASDGTM